MGPYYLVVRMRPGDGLYDNVSVSEHSGANDALLEARRWNEAYQTDEYRVVVVSNEGRKWVR